MMFEKKIWKLMKRKDINLFSNAKRIRFNLKSWHGINKNSGISLDLNSWQTIKKIMDKRNGYLQPIDKERNNDYYLRLIKEFQIDHRVRKIKD
jgi:hypothetical protein